MEGVLHKCSRGKGVSPVANWKERIVQVTWDEPVLRYFDPQLLLKGSMEIGTDLRVRLLEESEASGHKNAFEIKSAGESIIFYSIMPNGASKWVEFLASYNRTLDLRTIEAEKIRQITWVDGILHTASLNFADNSAARRLHLEDLLKTNISLTQALEEGTLREPGAVEAEMGAAAAFVRSHYLSSVRKALDVIRSSSLEKSRAVLALLQKLAEQVIFYATTGRKSLSLVASYQDKQELLLGVVGTGPIYGGNVPLLKTWVEKLSAALEKVAAHFLTGKPYNDRLLADFAAVSEEVGMYSSEPVADSLAGLRSLNMSPVTLKEVDVNFLLLDFKSGFGDLYSVRVLLALCESFSPEQVNTVPICEVVTKPLWTVIDATEGGFEQLQMLLQTPDPIPEPEPEPEPEGVEGEGV